MVCRWPDVLSIITSVLLFSACFSFPLLPCVVLLAVMTFTCIKTYYDKRLEANILVRHTWVPNTFCRTLGSRIQNLDVISWFLKPIHDFKQAKCTARGTINIDMHNGCLKQVFGILAIMCLTSYASSQGQVFTCTNKVTSTVVRSYFSFWGSK